MEIHTELERDFKFDRDRAIWVPKDESESYKRYNDLGILVRKGLMDEKSNYYSDQICYFLPSIIPLPSNEPISGSFGRPTFESIIPQTPQKILKKKADEDSLFLDPRKIKSELDKYVISQEDAKKSLSVAFSKLYKYHKNQIPNYISSNYLLIGPTGVGKTKLLETLSMLFEMPMEIVKTARLVQSGIVGDRIEEKFKTLKSKIDKKGRITNGLSIMYFDEIDKICSSGKYKSNIYGDAVQDELISVLDRTTISGVDTSKVLFIAGGAFENLDKIVLERMNKSKSIGFGSEIKSKNGYAVNDAYKTLSTDDLVSYGMKKELVGRFPSHTFLSNLNKDDIVKILTGCKDSIIKSTCDFYQKTDYVDIIFTDKSLELIADYSLASGTGARAAQGAVEKVLNKYEYKIMDYCGKTIVITAEVVRSELGMDTK